jgi:hypothetical protein
MVEHQMELEAEEPANAGFAPRGQIGESLVPTDAAIVAYGQRRAVDVVEPELWVSHGIIALIGFGDRGLI